MILSHRAVGGLPEFSETDQICILHESVFYIVKELCGWYREHYRAFELSPAPTRTLSLVTLSELLDTYPLADYKIGSARMVTLKRHIEIKGALASGWGGGSGYDNLLLSTLLNIVTGWCSTTFLLSACIYE